ncbi:hypothetical protein I4U23_004417 [Adineta vaga]|nr:hypothetical protein I4U23_004417 [Adineta vaga]
MQDTKYGRYQFNQSITDAVQQFTIKTVVEDWLVIFVFIFGTQYVYSQHYSIILTLLMYALTVLIIGSRQRGLTNLLHLSTHRCLATNKMLNFFCGTFLSGYNVFQSFYGTSKDIDYIALKESGICGTNRISYHVKRHLINLFHPKSSLKFLYSYYRNQFLTQYDYMPETIVRFIYLSLVLLLIIYTGNIINFILFWMIPFVTSYSWIISFIDLLDHYPMIDSAPRIDLYLSRNSLCGRIWSFFLAVHNDQYHLVHHLFPRIPYWNYPSAHLILMQDHNYAKLYANLGWRNILNSIVNVDGIGK